MNRTFVLSGLVSILLSAGCVPAKQATEPGAARAGPEAVDRRDVEPPASPPPTSTEAVAPALPAVVAAPKRPPSAAPLSSPAVTAPQVTPRVPPPVPSKPTPAVAAASALPPPAAARPAPPPPTPVSPTTVSPAPRPAPAPSLNLSSLEARLRETKAIGVFTKIALKNQVDDLLQKFRLHYKGQKKASMPELRQSYELLLMKVLAVLQDGDPSLARAIVASRESIWGILADPQKFSENNLMAGV
ncbi:MAG: hypothetical protein ABI661_01400 [Gammaproteobacteria bacterium]